MISLIVSALLLPQHAPVAATFAGDGPRVVIVDPTLQGEFDTGAGKMFANRVREGVGRIGLPTEAAGKTEACEDDACYGRIATGARATHLVRAVVKRVDRDYHLRLELRDASGATVTTVEDTCEICGVEEAADMLEAAATKLAGSMASGGGKATVAVKSRPPGATILVDGEEMGTTPAELELSAGPHRIELRKEGYAAAARTLELEEGMETASEMSLVPNAEKPDRGALIAGGVLIGGGIALLGGGIALVAIDGREYKKRCAGENVDADGDCRFVYRLKWPGAALVATGAILAGVGATILIVQRKRSKATLRAGVTPNGFTLRGSF